MLPQLHVYSISLILYNTYKDIEINVHNHVVRTRLHHGTMIFASAKGQILQLLCPDNTKTTSEVFDLIQDTLKTAHLASILSFPYLGTSTLSRGQSDTGSLSSLQLRTFIAS